MTGRAIQIAEPVTDSALDEDGGRFRFNQGFLRLISSPERLANAKVVIISVAGAFRKGKSFLLNFFLRYLRALSRGDATNWLRSEDNLSDGFHWRSGSDRDTTGILIWSEPFFITKPNGEEVAVLLMDTQGTFDHQSTQQDCTTIFAFSTLLSSVQIFNISQNIQETDLQYLRLFVEFAAMARNSEEREKVLQHLWFLVRDWQYPDECEYGENGGAAYLSNVLACDGRKPRENQELRRGIQQHFEKASCCLLPHPGQAITRKAFCGEISSLESEFVVHLGRFVPLILSPSNLVVKRINGTELTGREFLHFVEVYFEAFRLGKLPTPKSIFTATVEMANLAAAADAQKFFEDSLQSMSDQTGTVSDQELDDLLKVMLVQAMEQFDSKCMEKSSRDTGRTRQRLEEQLQGLFQQQRMFNRLKSDSIAAEVKNKMLNEDIKRMQSESLDAARRMVELEEEFTERLQEVQSKSISKEEMEAQLQEVLVRQSVAQKALEKKNEALVGRIEEMAERNKALATELKENREQAERQQQQMMENWKKQMKEIDEERQRSNEGKGGSNVLTDVVLPIVANVATAVVARRCCIS